METRTQMRIISYNLRKNLAHTELFRLVSVHDPDVLCLQECDGTMLPEHLGDLKLADATKANRLGLALYYRASAYELTATKIYALRKALHDRFFAPAHERLLAAKLTHIDSGEAIAVASFHASPLSASNYLRRKQINAAHEHLREFAPNRPVIMVGDFNYPWFSESLGKTLQRSGFTLTHADEPTYFGYKYVSGHFDFATSTEVQIDRIQSLPQGASDHRPILVHSVDTFSGH